MKNATFYLGIALLFTHELDAISNHEWRVLPILRSLPDATSETIFLIAHLPVFILVITFIASLRLRTRATARNLFSAFLVLHALLHFAFSGDPAYEFSSSLSSILIYGAGLCGITYFIAEAKRYRVRTRPSR